MNFLKVGDVQTVGPLYVGMNYSDQRSSRMIDVATSIKTPLNHLPLLILDLKRWTSEASIRYMALDAFSNHLRFLVRNLKELTGIYRFKQFSQCLKSCISNFIGS